MVELRGAVTVQGVVHLLGEYSAAFGEPAVAIAIEPGLTLQVEPAEFDFFIVDGYKLDEKKHRYFHEAIEKLWNGAPLEFSTSSQLPMISGLGIPAALIASLTQLLMKLNNDKEENPKPNKSNTLKSQIACQAFAIERGVHQAASPLGTSTALAGGTVLMYDIPAGAFWSVPDRNKTWYMHQLNALENLSLVIGYLADNMTTKYSLSHPAALFDSSSKTSLLTKKTNEETIPGKLTRLMSKTSFSRDIIKDLGKTTRAGVQAITDGHLAKAGEMMQEQQNLITILGVYPPELRPLAAAAEQHSFGVGLTGTNGDAIVALTEKPELVADKIRGAGGETIITKPSIQRSEQ